MDKSIKKLSHQEILQSKPTVEKVLQMKRTPLVIVVDSLRSLYNIGSIFRSGDAILVEKIFLCGLSGKPPNKEIEKVALGAAEVVPFEYIEKVEDCLRNLKELGYDLIALELTDSSKNYHQLKYKFPCALILGNEIDGVSENAMKLIDRAVDIPMLGRANSLNVATAMAVVGYEIFNQYSNNEN